MSSPQQDPNAEAIHEINTTLTHMCRRLNGIETKQGKVLSALRQTQLANGTLHDISSTLKSMRQRLEGIEISQEKVLATLQQLQPAESDTEIPQYSESPSPESPQTLPVFEQCEDYDMDVVESVEEREASETPVQSEAGAEAGAAIHPSDANESSFESQNNPTPTLTPAVGPPAEEYDLTSAPTPPHYDVETNELAFRTTPINEYASRMDIIDSPTAQGRPSDTDSSTFRVTAAPSPMYSMPGHDSNAKLHLKRAATQDKTDFRKDSGWENIEARQETGLHGKNYALQATDQTAEVQEMMSQAELASVGYDEENNELELRDSYKTPRKTEEKRDGKAGTPWTDTNKSGSLGAEARNPKSSLTPKQARPTATPTMPDKGTGKQTHAQTERDTPSRKRAASSSPPASPMSKVAKMSKKSGKGEQRKKKGIATPIKKHKFSGVIDEDTRSGHSSSAYSVDEDLFSGVESSGDEAMPVNGKKGRSGQNTKPPPGPAKRR
ncbi:hypothetical protein LTR04_001162 [Oleoguttula sp. CCFEE 6159]|nr:hypothetical protein LTR04_001162 [Oleoguttula sp. CCFEE 6159]